MHIIENTFTRLTTTILYRYRLMSGKVYARLLLCLQVLLLAYTSQAAISIDSVTTRRSNCANDGIISVYARTTNPPLLYAITGGPLNRPYQNTSSFGGLPPGTYTVKVINFGGDTTYQMATVPGNYKFPDFTVSYQGPSCGNPGMIVGKVIGGTGHSPYNWQLTRNSTGQVTTQAKDTFTNLSPGAYTLRLYDSCQAFTTRTVTLTGAIDSFALILSNPYVVDCKKARLTFTVRFIPGQISKPVTATIYTAYGNYQISLKDSANEPRGYIVTRYVVPIGYGDWYRIAVTDACGRKDSMSDDIPPFSQFSGSTPLTHSTPCTNDYFLQFNLFGAAAHGPLTLTVTDSTGARVDSVTVDDSVAVSSIKSRILPPGTYRAVLRDTCGNSITKSMVISGEAAIRILHYPTTTHCRDSVGAMDIAVYNFKTNVKINFISGPPIISSTKPHFAYTDSLIYGPARITGWGGSSTSNNYQAMTITNLAVGTYIIEVTDNCGSLMMDTFTVLPQNLSHDVFEATYTKGCPGQSTIDIAFNTKPGGTPSVFYVKNLSTGDTIYRGAYIDTIYNVDYSTRYAVSVAFSSYSDIRINKGTDCLNLFDTVIIPPYTQPSIAYVSVIKCNGQVIAILNPDSSRGLAPYRYELISGPQTATLQSANYFLLPLQGSYTARVIDTCGNAQTFTFVVDTISFPPIGLAGSPCIGNNVSLYAETSPYFKYTWRMPDGTVYVGDTLHINPLTSFGVGEYHITRQVNINNCIDTLSTTYTIDGYQTSYIDRQICIGSSIVFGGNSYTTPGTYRDTIATNGCDSIVIMDLTVVEYFLDSVTQTICAGQSVTVDANTYTQTGVYRHRYPTASCDSMYVLNLVVNDLKRDSVVVSICTGQSVTVGANTYNQTGVYRDTFATAGCDSIYILNLAVADFKTTTLTNSICAGESVSMGGRQYTATGTYTDTLPTATCDSVVTLQLQVNIPDTIYDPGAICAGKFYTWQDGVYRKEGIYTKNFTSSKGCDSVMILTLQVNPIPSVDIWSEKKVATRGRKLQLNATSNGQVSYIWTPSWLLDDATIASPTAILEEAGWIAVTVTDTATQCSNEDSLYFLIVEPTCDSTQIFIPNAFTPGNSDDLNDYFRIFWQCPFRVFNIKIYNRWGELVYESDTERFGWDGTHKGVLQKPDVFVYVLTAVGANGEQMKYEGSVTLIR